MDEQIASKWIGQSARKRLKVLDSGRWRLDYQNRCTPRSFIVLADDLWKPPVRISSTGTADRGRREETESLGTHPWSQWSVDSLQDVWKEMC